MYVMSMARTLAPLTLGCLNNNKQNLQPWCGFDKRKFARKRMKILHTFQTCWFWAKKICVFQKNFLNVKISQTISFHAFTHYDWIILKVRWYSLKCIVHVLFALLLFVNSFLPFVCATLDTLLNNNKAFGWLKARVDAYSML